MPQADVWGVTKWLSKDKVLILLSLTYKSNDQVWFRLFHAACHVLRHGKKRMFYEFGKTDRDAMEKEADNFAADALIPKDMARHLPFLKTRSGICDFAARIGVAPGIVVDRLQHDKMLAPGRCNDLKVQFVRADSKSNRE